MLKAQQIFVKSEGDFFPAATFSHRIPIGDRTLSIAGQRKVLVTMAFKTDAMAHLSLMFILSLMAFPLRRRSLVALIFLIPALIEIVQFLMPSRVPDFMDAFHGYLGILLAYCLMQMWREIIPAVKKFRLRFKRPEAS